MSRFAVIYLEERFQVAEGGRFFSFVFGNAFWLRYLEVYDYIYIVARSEPASNQGAINPEWFITDDRIRLIEIPYYKGAAQFLRSLVKIACVIKLIAKMPGCHILRLPGAIGSLALPFIILAKQKYGVELVGDPIGVFSAGGVGGRFSSVYRKCFTFMTKQACRHAAGVAYVTREAMQKVYPPSKTAFATNFSSIELPRQLIVGRKQITPYLQDRPIVLFMAGSMEQRYKGFDIMIKALDIIIRSGFSVQLKIAGDGMYRKELQDLLVTCGLEGSVILLGKISRSEVLENMDAADIFVMASRTEGLPRVLIEAMARGLPAIGSNVGGIPELLSAEYIFESENYQQLAEKICVLIIDVAQRESMSKANIITACEYEESHLLVRQKAFYNYLATVSECG